MFETLTISTLILGLFFWWQNRRLGLTASVPLDPKARMQLYCSDCLVLLKQSLHQATITHCSPQCLRFTSKGELHQLKQQQDHLYLTCQDQPLASKPLGEQGHILFEHLSEKALLATVHSRSAEGEHRVSLRLEVCFELEPV